MAYRPQKKIPCVILAGGFGTRLRSVLPDRPKCLAPVGNTFFLALLIRHLRSMGFERFYLSLGYLAEQVRAEVETLPLSDTISFATEKEPLGTGGGVLNASNLFSEEEFVVVNGDTWIDGNLSHLFEPLEINDNRCIRLTGVYRDDCSRYGAICEHNKVVSRITKGVAGPGIIDGGYYRVSRRIFEDRELGSTFSLDQDVIREAIERGGATVDHADGTFVDIGVPASYKRFIKMWQTK